eukprot:m51a1_g10037 hypothetical protein (369) ;mRNA; f:14834-16354
MSPAAVAVALVAALAVAAGRPSGCSSDCAGPVPPRRHQRAPLACQLPPRRVLALPGMSRGLPYYAATELGAGQQPQYTLAVSYQHGMYSDPDVHYCAMLGALGKAPVRLQRYLGGNASVLVIAPHFQDSWSRVPDSEVFWDGQDWNMGDNSSSNRRGEATISSFSVYDHLVSVLMNRAVYPNMRRVVLVGHSAGGQTMVRYSLGTRTPAPSGGLRLVVANPSSFPYLDELRPVPPQYKAFKHPTDEQLKYCDDWNSWRYGLNEMNEYMNAIGTDKARRLFPAKDVVYLLGTADTCNEYLDPHCESHGLDKGCEAMLQGRWRYERGLIWMSYLAQFYGRSTHTQVDVQNVAHDETAMVQAQEALPVFFD